MRGLALFARSRRWLLVTAVALVSAGLVVFCGPLGYTLNPRAGYLVAVAAQVPLLSAIATQASLAASHASSEMHPARSLVPLRLAHVIVCTAVPAILLGVAATLLNGPAEEQLSGLSDVGATAVVRNLFALTGACFICAAIVGPSFGWTLPVAWATIPYFALSGPSADPTGILTLLIQPDAAFLPFVVACAGFTIGAILAVRGWSVPWDSLMQLRRPPG